VLRFNDTERILKMSVHDVVDAGPPAGHLSMVGASAGRARMTAGVAAHTTYQAHRAHEDADFAGEVQVKHRMMVGGWEVVITGRMDGLSQEGDHHVVEEVKSSALGNDRLSILCLADMPSAVLQLQMYMYALAATGLSAIGRLVLISVRDGTQHVLHVPVDPQFGTFLEAQLGWIIDKRERQLAWLLRRREATVPFAHADWRTGQLAVAEEVEEVCERGAHLLLSAPTGLGKTAGVLHGALVAAYRSNRRVYFATARTTQQRMVEETVRQIASAGLPIKAVSIRARDKACLNEVVACRPDCCRYAHGHHDKVRSEGLYDALWAEAAGVIRVPSPDEVSVESAAAVVCPFALSMELTREADVVIGDYNYAFDASRRISAMSDAPGDWIVIVDEAHNLPDRARGYASPELKRSVLVEALEGLSALPPFTAMAELVAEVLDWVDALLEELPHRGELALSLEDGLNVSDVNRFSGRFEAIGMDYALLKTEHPPFSDGDPFSDIARVFSRMRMVLERAGEETVVICRAEGGREPAGLKMLCRDPAPVLAPIFEDLFATVIMSATLRPMDFYAAMFGLAADRTFSAELDSPFPPENRRVLVVADVSTEYRKRDRDKAAIAAHVERAIAAVPGNVAVFFSSFALRDSIAAEMGLMGRPVIFQERKMGEPERAAVLDTLARGENHVLLGVLGGIFAEGIDLPGTGLLAAVIVGPALPAVGLERKLMSAWYQELYDNGFRYAYQVPGMARVVQAAGRVIRSPEDLGAIVLIGQRFLRRDYQAFFPPDWSPQRTADLGAGLEGMWPSDGVTDGVHGR
jgi:DNA excision repair protein ERCC-2